MVFGFLRPCLRSYSVMPSVFATPRTFTSALQCGLSHRQAMFFNLSRRIWHSENRSSWYVLI